MFSVEVGSATGLAELLSQELEPLHALGFRFARDLRHGKPTGPTARGYQGGKSGRYVCSLGCNMDCSLGSLGLAAALIQCPPREDKDALVSCLF